MSIDYYNSAEAALIAFLKAQLSAYYPNAAKQVTASDDEILSNGNDYYAVAYPGNFPITEVERSATFLQYEWEILLDLLVRWNKSCSVVNLQALSGCCYPGNQSHESR